MFTYFQLLLQTEITYFEYSCRIDIVDNIESNHNTVLSVDHSTDQWHHHIARQQGRIESNHTLMKTDSV